MSSSLQELSKALKVVVAMLHPGWEPGVFSFMRSMPGGAEQEPHQDYQESDLVRAREHHPGGVPASMIFALEPGTKLRIYVGCFTARDDSKARVVEIPVGFCVLFRGDLIHNGMPYTTTNYRLHCYLSYAGMKWTPDIVQDALPQHGECQYCGEKVEKGQALRKHRFYCEKNPKGVENRLKRKREYKKGKYKCEVCDKVFKRQSSLRVHKMREHSA
ncbi:hypothetical protein AM587_10012248 [Phytophthora nicotianae]|uniref:C2H2-type domain-containing protein n=1 Tax=Phytophthora nicotianae TaxID=4792 RepID=A0A0W8C7P0_PHYNI|nr:hypothetical protein AM587_10012248 [Phytophthora nicotianae]